MGCQVGPCSAEAVRSTTPVTCQCNPSLTSPSSLQWADKWQWRADPMGRHVSPTQWAVRSARVVLKPSDRQHPSLVSATRHRHLHRLCSGLTRGNDGLTSPAVSDHRQIGLSIGTDQPTCWPDLTAHATRSVKVKVKVTVNVDLYSASSWTHI